MLEQTCRTCLATCGELVAIFSNDYYVRDLPDKLYHTTRIEVSKDDELPKMMCKKCVFLVDSLYCFKDQCEMAEIKLKKSLKSIDNEDTCPIINNYEIKISNKVSNHSEGSSSEEDYQIEYASEEARLEVESAKKRRHARKKHNKAPSGVKVKSVEILDSRTKENIYKNLCAPTSSYVYEPEVQENTMITDSEDGSSLYLSEDSRKYFSSISEVQNFEPQSYHNSVDTGILKPSNEEDFEEVPSNSIGLSSNTTLKRKMESDSSYSQLTKVPKKVMFEDNDYRDENMQMIEVANDKGNLCAENTSENSVVQVNIIENSSGKIVHNYGIPPKEDFIMSKKVLETRIKNLVKHLVINLPEVCAICSQSFDTYSGVLEHKIKSHLRRDQDFFFCPICHDKFYSNNSLVNHLNNHTEIHSYICILCTGSYYTEDTLRTHLLTHVDIRELKCKICSKNFQRIQQLVSHVKQHVSKKHLVCSLCSTNFETKDKLQNHIDQEHRKCEEADAKWEETEEVSFENVTEDTEDTAKDPGFPCPYCEQMFKVKSTLRDHVFTHLGGQLYSCMVCEKSFPSQEDRTKHMEEHMKPPQKGDFKKFRCRVCHEILVSRIAYGHHLKEKHWNSTKPIGESSEQVSESYGKTDDVSAFDSVSST